VDKILDRDPALYPFRDLMREDALVGQVGGADTTRTMTELVSGHGPRESYPDEFQFTPPRQILYNVPQQTPREYNLENRTRYWGVVNDRVTAKKEKVLKIIRTLDPDKLFLIGEEGDLRVLDYVIVSTGFERLAIEDELQKAGIGIEDYRDATGQVVGLGNMDNGVMINGPATGFGKDRFPPQIRAIIDALGIKENTVALWVYQILITRMMWTIFLKRQ
jgi:hypothetical protein